MNPCSVADAKAAEGSGTETQKEHEIDEVMEFLKFSVKPNTNFGGTIFFKFKNKENAEVTTTYAVEIDDELRVSTRKNVRANEIIPTCEVTISMDDFLWIYSGKASSSDLIKLFYAGRVSISGFAFRTVSKFANSFDFSSEKWNAFYAWRNAQEERNKSDELLLDKTGGYGSLSGDYELVQICYFFDRYNFSRLQSLLWKISLASLLGPNVILESVQCESRGTKLVVGRISLVGNVSQKNTGLLSELRVTPDQILNEQEPQGQLKRFLFPDTKRLSEIVDSVTVDNSKHAGVVFDFFNEEYIVAVKLSAKKRQQRRYNRNRVDLGEAGMAQLDKLVKVIGKGGHSNLKRDNRSKYVPAPELLLREFRLNVAVIMDKLKEKASGRKALHNIPVPEMDWLVRDRHSGSMVIADPCSTAVTGLPAIPCNTPCLQHSITVGVNRAGTTRNWNCFDARKQRVKAKFVSISRELVNHRNPSMTSDEHLFLFD